MHFNKHTLLNYLYLFFTKNWHIIAKLVYKKKELSLPTNLDVKLSELLGDFKALSELAPIGIVQVLLDANCIFSNRYWYELLETTPHYVIGKPWLSFVHPEDLEKIQTKWDLAIKNSTKFKAEFRIKTASGHVFWVSCNASPLSNATATAPATYLAVIADITEQYLHKKNLSYLAHTDALTGLCNRMLFQEKLKDALMRSIRANKYVVLLFLDLDGFKIINDTLGHDAGDNLLQQVAKRLIDNVRQTDTIARLGGDEFTILFENVDTPSRISVSAKKVIDALAKPFMIKENEVHVTASIGIAVGSKETEDHLTLIKQADIAMYTAKEHGKNNFQYFTDELNKEVHRKMQISTNLYKALETNEFQPFYQPQINMATKEVVGAEVLLRWFNKEFGLVSPAEFVPIAEDNGLIIPISEWLIKTTCSQFVTFKANNSAYSHAHISINLSPRHFGNKSLIPTIKNAIAESKINPQDLVFEITESILIGNRQETKNLLLQLKDLGAAISLDDFGTGYSSLSYLCQFPIDYLKIDQSFIKQLFIVPSNASIVAAIIAMSKSLNLQLVAEGVETKEMADFLVAHGCHIAQGYLYAKPMPANEFANWQVPNI